MLFGSRHRSRLWVSFLCPRSVFHEIPTPLGPFKGPLLWSSSYILLQKSSGLCLLLPSSHGLKRLGFFKKTVSFGVSEDLLTHIGNMHNLRAPQAF